MCGIFAYKTNTPEKVEEKRQILIELTKRLRHRGPDWNGYYIDQNNGVFIGHERLSIVGVENGSQPIVSEEHGIVLSVNGEIYNYKELYKTVLHGKYAPMTRSDCEVIIYLYLEFGDKFISMLDGVFSFVLYDLNNWRMYVARDPIGINPLYYGTNETEGEITFASELKCLTECEHVEIFPPGHYMVASTNTNSIVNDKPKIYKYYKPGYLRDLVLPDKIPHSENYYCNKINLTLTDAVRKRLMCDVPFGVLLSGGLDSSLIASITTRLMKETHSRNSLNYANSPNQFGDKIHSFSIGLEGAPDLYYAKTVADYLGTIHHEFVFTIQEGLDAIRDLVYTLDTYDVTTIRASTPMYLMSRKIKAMGIKMVLSGEGADEIFGGYLYFHNAPNAESFDIECRRRIENLHHFDCLRANKSTMAWGVEPRVPFLDKTFLETAMPIHPDLKLAANKKDDKKIEKYILRKAFDTPENPYLPDEILWRQKEQFSDGVGYSWIDSLKEYCESNIRDEEMNMEVLKERYPVNTPQTKEALFYRKTFEDQFPNRGSADIKIWVPRVDWEGVSYDPSGRAQGVHDSTTITSATE